MVKQCGLSIVFAHSLYRERNNFRSLAIGGVFGLLALGLVDSPVRRLGRGHSLIFLSFVNFKFAWSIDLSVRRFICPSLEPRTRIHR